MFAYRWTQASAERRSLGQPALWVLIFVVMAGTVAANLRGIALGTCVSLLAPEDDRERAELLIDLDGAMQAVRAVPGLGWLIGLAAFNNLLAGVFMSLMDAYALELVRVEVWGLIFAATSCGFVIGGLIVSRHGLGGRPPARLFGGKIVCWLVAAIFPIGPSIVVVGIGSLIWLTTMPVIEAAEQTVLQRVVPFERQGRVFGFAQAIESAAAPVTALVIGRSQPTSPSRR